jgi:hypothetical protein
MKNLYSKGQCGGCSIAAIVITLLLLAVGLMLPNISSAETGGDASFKKIAVFIKVEDVFLGEYLSVHDKIVTEDQNPTPVPNQPHISLRHVKGEFTPQQLEDFINTVKFVASNNPLFSFTQSTHASIDEDEDVGLELNAEKPFFTLREQIMAIPAPEPGKTYAPHTTLYYQVRNHDAVEKYLKLLTLDPNQAFLACKVGVGELGQWNNVIKVLAVFPLAKCA